MLRPAFSLLAPPDWIALRAVWKRLRQISDRPPSSRTTDADLFPCLNGGGLVAFRPLTGQLSETVQRPVPRVAILRRTKAPICCLGRVIPAL